MNKLRYKPTSAKENTLASRGVELDLSRLELLENSSVRGVALKARDVKVRIDADPSYKIFGTYSEAYSGE